jgi:hypothetical protein
MGEAADIDVRPPVPVRTEPHQKTSWTSGNVQTAVALRQVAVSGKKEVLMSAGRGAERSDNRSRARISGIEHEYEHDF